MTKLDELMKDPQPINVPLDKMGYEISPKYVSLFQSFMQIIGAGQFDAEYLTIERQKIVCPYCGKYLKLIKVKPVYSGGINTVPSTLRHSANNYEFRCDCGVNFFGTYQWLWID